jgi:proteasome beta subunit
VSTIVGIECAGGTVVAGDRTRAEGGTVRSKRARHVFDFETAGAAAVGDGVDDFARRLESEVDAYRTERGEEMGIEALARVAADLVTAVEGAVSALVSARDDEGRARLREIGPDGQVTPQTTAALGGGAALAYGRLEAADLDVDLDAAAEVAEEVLATAAERDTETGEEIDLWRLENEDAAE